MAHLLYRAAASIGCIGAVCLILAGIGRLAETSTAPTATAKFFLTILREYCTRWFYFNSFTYLVAGVTCLAIVILILWHTDDDIL